MTSTLPPAVQAVSGGVGSFAANAVLFPLDVVVTRMQTSNSKASKAKAHRSWQHYLRELIEEDGWSGLYSGFVSDSLATLISNYIYFYAYSLFREKMLGAHMRRAETLKALPAHPSPYPTRKPTPIALSTGEELGAGFLAGALSRLVSTPLSVITVRMQAKRERGSQNPGLIAALRSIYREEGILGLWKGLESTLLLCSNPAITLFLFQLYGRFALRGRTPTAGQAFIGGAVSNALAVALLYPAIITKTVVQNKRQSITLSQAFKDVVRSRGLAGLYDGLQPQIVKGFFKEGLTMMTKARIEALVIALYILSRRRSVS